MLNRYNGRVTIDHSLCRKGSCAAIHVNLFYEFGFLCIHGGHGEGSPRYANDMSITLIEEPGGCTAGVARMVKGEVDIAQGDDSVGHRYNGTEGFERNTDVRHLMSTLSNPVTFFVLKETDITSIYELDGKKFGTGYAASITGRTVRAVFDGLGIQPEYFEAATAANAQATKDRQIVGFGKGGAPDAIVTEIATTTPITVLELTDEDFAKIKQKHPELSRDVIAAGAYPGQDKELGTVGMIINYACMKELPADLAYKFVDACWEGRQEIGASYASMNREKGGILGFPEFTLETAVAPLHEGAVKWYRDKGYTVPDSMIPPEMK